MLQEHCEGADAMVPFTAATYMLTTTSHIEWWFVVDPLEGLKHVNVRHELGDEAVPRLSPSGWPAEAGVLSAERARQPRPLQAVLQEMKVLRIGPQLKATGVEPLIDAEVIATRLYTGPLHTKYCAVLKGLTRVHVEKPSEAQRQQDEEQQRHFESQRAQIQSLYHTAPSAEAATAAVSAALAIGRTPSGAARAGRDKAHR